MSGREDGDNLTHDPDDERARPDTQCSAVRSCRYRPAMTTPNLGSILIDAAKTDAAMISTSRPTRAHEHPIIWVVPALILIGIVQACGRRSAEGGDSEETAQCRVSLTVGFA
jgi:hypothetical protein